jgi:hypothetical protein
MGPKTLPCLLQFSLQLWFPLWISLERVYPLDMILIFCNMHGERFFWFWTRGLGAILYQMLMWCLGTPQSSTVFFSKIPLIISVIRYTFSVVECFCQNTNWWSGRIQFSYSIRCNLLSIAFLKILLIVGSRVISLHELASSSTLTDFGIIMICMTFHWTGKYPVLIIALHIAVRWTVTFLGISFNILPVIRSYPGAFLGLRSSCIMFWISFDVRNLIGCVISSSSFSSLLILVWKSSFCGSSFCLDVFS